MVHVLRGSLWSALAVVGCLAALPACDRASAPKPIEGHAKDEPKSLPVEPLTSAAAGSDHAPPGPDDTEAPELVPAGSPFIPLRTIDFALYLHSPVTPALAADAEQKVHTRFPAATLLQKPQPVPPPNVLVFAPGSEDLPVPTAEELSRFGRDLTAAQIATAAASKGAMLFAWLLDADPTFAELRKAQLLVHEIAQKNAGFIWDDTTRELFSVESWKKARIDGWQGDIPDMRNQLTTHYYETDTGHRAVTLGLAKLGLPDLVVQDVPPPLSGPMALVLGAIAQTFVEGGMVGADGRLALDLKAIHHPLARAGYLAAAGPTATFRGHVTLAVVDPEEGDAENRLAEVRFDGYPGATEAERQAAALHAMLGAIPDHVAPAKPPSPPAR